MKRPDNNTLTLWYCYVMFGVIATWCLHSFAHIRWVYTIWFTIPIACLIGSMIMSALMASVDREIERKTTVLQSIDVPGLGKLEQYAEHWSIVVPVKITETEAERMEINFYDLKEPPSNALLDVVRSVRDHYFENQQKLQNALRQEYAEDPIDFDDPDIFIEPDSTVEFMYGNTDGSDMGYSVCTKDWNVTDIYAGD